MSNAALETFIKTYVRNSAIDSFYANRMQTILLQLLMGGVTDTFDTYDQFEAAILTNREGNKDWYMRARVNATGFIYEYFPDTGEINWTASQKLKTI